MRKIYEAALILIGTLGWWGFVYPELCLSEDVYEQEVETEQEIDPLSIQETEEQGNKALPQKSRQSLENGFMAGKIRIKSRIVEYLYQEKDNSEKILKAEKR